MSTSMYGCEVYAKIKSGVFKITERIKARSPIWTLFGEVQKDDGTLIPDTVFCRMCQKLLKYNGKTTSNLVRHRCNILRNAANDCIKQLAPFGVHGAENGQEAIVDEARKQLDQKAKQSLVAACSEWESEDRRSISSLDTSNFRKMVQTFIKLGAQYGEDLDINDVIPDSKTISHQIFTISEGEPLDIKTDIEDSIIEDTEYCEPITDNGSESDCSLAFSEPLVTNFSAQKRILKSPRSNHSNKIFKHGSNTINEPKEVSTAKVVNVEPPSPNRPNQMCDILRPPGKEDCSVYGDHIACKMRQYSTRTKNIAQHHINNILFDADMGKFELNATHLSEPSA